MVTSVTNTEEQIVSEALALIGEAGITDIDGTDNRSVLVKRIYPGRRSAVMFMYPWRFTLRKASLSDTGVDPTSEWEQEYTIPAEAEVIRALWDDNTATANRIKRYEIYGTTSGQVLQCDETEAVADYQIAILDPQYWPPHFRQLLVYDLAAHFAVPFAEDEKKAEMWMKTAYGTPQDDMKGGYYRTARQVDASQQPGQVLTDHSLVVVRH